MNTTDQQRIGIWPSDGVVPTSGLPPGSNVVCWPRPGLADQYAQFLSGTIRGHSHFLTVTIRDEFERESAFNRRERLESGVRHFLNRLSRKCFRRRHRREGCAVARTVVIEQGATLRRFHAHITLERPLTVSESEFVEHVHTALERCRSLGREYKLQRITNTVGLASYLAKDGPDSFSLSSSQRA